MNSVIAPFELVPSPFEGGGVMSFVQSENDIKNECLQILDHKIHLSVICPFEGVGGTCNLFNFTVTAC